MSDTEYNKTRRKMLQGLGLAVVTGSAGCTVPTIFDAGNERTSLIKLKLKNTDSKTRQYEAEIAADDGTVRQFTGQLAPGERIVEEKLVDIGSYLSAVYSIQSSTYAVSGNWHTEDCVAIAISATIATDTISATLECKSATRP